MAVMSFSQNFLQFRLFSLISEFICCNSGFFFFKSQNSVFISESHNVCVIEKLIQREVT